MSPDPEHTDTSEPRPQTPPPAAEASADAAGQGAESAHDQPADGQFAGEAGQAGDGATSADEFTPEQIDALVAERDEFLDAYRRTAADFDNFRKLAQKRLADEVTRSQGAFVERLLPVLDAVDAARAQAGDAGDTGVDAVAGALFGFLEREGLSRVAPLGEPFDPNVAEAVVHEPAADDSAHDEPVVSEVLRSGYLWHGRVLRAAMVKVSG